MNKAIWGEIAQKRRSHTKEVEKMEKMVKASHGKVVLKDKGNGTSHGTRMGITARMVTKMGQKGSARMDIKEIKPVSPRV